MKKATKTKIKVEEQAIQVRINDTTLEGDLNTPNPVKGVVLFAHGSGSSRHSPRNRQVANLLNQAGFATLLIDLLTPEEEVDDRHTGHFRFNISFLADRLFAATEWLTHNPTTQDLKVGYFGASTGAGAALMAASQHPEFISAIVSRGGRPDLAGPALRGVKAPTLLIVGGSDVPLIGMNQAALRHLAVEKRVEIIPGATHLFEETGALEKVAQSAQLWFERHLGSAL